MVIRVRGPIYSPIDFAPRFWLKLYKCNCTALRMSTDIDRRLFWDRGKEVAFLEEKKFETKRVRN